MTDRPFEVAEGQGGLKIESLRKSYHKRLVIRNVSMQLHRGEVVALLGPNGSGKTTCFYSIAGLVTPEGGKVSIAGRLSQRKGELRLTLAGLAGMELSQLEVFLPAAIDAKDLRAAEISGGRLVTLDADSGALRIEVNAEEIKIRYGL